MEELSWMLTIKRVYMLESISQVLTLRLCQDNGSTRLAPVREYRLVIIYGFQDTYYKELLKISMYLSALNLSSSKIGMELGAILTSPLKP